MELMNLYSSPLVLFNAVFVVAISLGFFGLIEQRKRDEARHVAQRKRDETRHVAQRKKDKARHQAELAKYKTEPGKAVDKIKELIKGNERKSEELESAHWDLRQKQKQVETLQDLLSLLGHGGFPQPPVDIRMIESRWYPQKLQKNRALIKMYRSSANSDVEFTVGSTAFKAHMCVLLDHCKVLYDIVTVSGSARSESFPIIGHTRAAFKTLLEYVYTVKEPVLGDFELIKDVLVVADQFEVIELKMLAESKLAYELISVENFGDLLVLAHSRSCPLLKEECMKFYTMNAESCFGSKGWGMIGESPVLLRELLEFSSITNKTFAEKSKVETWDVVTLRKALEKEGLDVDGSREVLIKRLNDRDAQAETA